MMILLGLAGLIAYGVLYFLIVSAAAEFRGLQWIFIVGFGFIVAIGAIEAAASRSSGALDLCVVGSLVITFGVVVVRNQGIHAAERLRIARAHLVLAFAALRIAWRELKGVFQ